MYHIRDYLDQADIVHNEACMNAAMMDAAYVFVIGGFALLGIAFVIIKLAQFRLSPLGKWMMLFAIGLTVIVLSILYGVTGLELCIII